MYIDLNEDNTVDEKNAFEVVWKLVTYFNNFDGARKVLDHLPDRHAVNDAFKRCSIEWALKKDFYKATKFAQLAGQHKDAAYLECTRIFLEQKMPKEAKWCAELAGLHKAKALHLLNNNTERISIQPKRTP